MCQYFVAADALFTRREHHRRQLLPLLGKSRAEQRYVAVALGRRQLVSLCEDDAERDAFASEHLYEAQIYALRFEPRVDQHEQIVHLLAAQHVVRYQLRKFATLALRHACISVTGQIDQIPAVIDQKVVYQLRLAGRARDLGQRAVARQHVYKRRLADVAAPDKGYVAQIVLRDLRNALRAALEYGFVDAHSVRNFILPLPTSPDCAAGRRRVPCLLRCSMPAAATAPTSEAATDTP